MPRKPGSKTSKSKDPKDQNKVEAASEVAQVGEAMEEEKKDLDSSPRKTRSSSRNTKKETKNEEKENVIDVAKDKAKNGKKQQEAKEKNDKKEKEPANNEKQTKKKIKTNDHQEKPVEVVEKAKKTEEVTIEVENKKGSQKITETIVTETTTTEKILPREFYTRDVVTLSKELLGKIIVRKYDNKVIKCRIVEAEAYAGIPDKACHAYNGKKTDRNKAMYREGGHVYVYSIYGNNNCLNITASKEGDPSATLIRAVEIVEGFEHAVENRNASKVSKTGKELTNGPGKVCAAMKIDKTFNELDITKPGELYIIDDTKSFEVSITKRINIDYAEEYVHKPWRFSIKDNVYVSVKGVPADPEPAS